MPDSLFELNTEDSSEYVDIKDHSHKFLKAEQTFLFGPPGYRQFLLQDGYIYCMRQSSTNPDNPCSECKFSALGCQFVKEKTVRIDPIPHSRSVIGFELRPFLHLRFKPGQSPETIAQHLNDRQRAAIPAYYHESNKHWVFQDLRKDKLIFLKGKVRYYGTREELSSEPFADAFDIVQEYIPNQLTVAQDFSAQEPKTTTICTREPKYMDVFKGFQNEIIRHLDPGSLDASLFDAEQEKHPWRFHLFKNQLYCILEGELDKTSFKEQCASCSLKASCRFTESYFKSVPGDFHAANATALYGSVFTECQDKYEKKHLRANAKIVGLGLCISDKDTVLRVRRKKTKS